MKYQNRKNTYKIQWPAQSYNSQTDTQSTQGRESLSQAAHPHLPIGQYISTPRKKINYLKGLSCDKNVQYIYFMTKITVYQQDGSMAIQIQTDVGGV